MTAAFAIYRRIAPLLALALIPTLILLAIAKGDARHWHKKSDRFEQLYRGEQTAHAVTVANYRAAAERARAADAANAARVVAEQKAINERTSHEYQARIATARAAADRLRGQLSQAPANPGGGGTAPMSRFHPTTIRAVEAASKDGFSLSDRLAATEQAIQLDELIKWVKRQAGIDVNGEKRPPAPARP